MDIKEKIKAFPDSPGVYLMKDKTGRILYAGKASSLRKRVNSYFQKLPTAKTQALLGRIKDIDYIQTPSTAAALLLENALI
ncbi:MAG: GIY-YIG nuclease family protein, partial [Candidatus Omnitrophica bacterium]|nr:GIY-YIG nuclease family protein [Candidatus Omnitrophota bacterium]